MEKMVRKAADNKYFHRDFHFGLNIGLDYIAEVYGEDAVVEYLQQYTRVYHKPLMDAVKKDGLKALEDYFVKLYDMEEAPDAISINKSKHELIICVKECPVIKYVKNNGKRVSPYYIETTNTVNRTLVEDSPYAFEMISFDKETGKSQQRFYKREV